MRTLAAYLVVAVVVLGCPRPLPNPGQVVLSCVMDAAKDPALRDAVMNALAQPNWAAAIASLIVPGVGATAEAIACILNSFLGKASADPAHPELRQRAREYLKSHGYEVP
jgi:hypothetical protein